MMTRRRKLLSELRSARTPSGGLTFPPSRVELTAERVGAQTSEAYWFPVIGGCVLSSLYFGFKYLGKYWINKLLSGYFLLIGLGAIAQVSTVPDHSLNQLRSSPVTSDLVWFDSPHALVCKSRAGGY